MVLHQRHIATAMVYEGGTVSVLPMEDGRLRHRKARIAVEIGCGRSISAFASLTPGQARKMAALLISEADKATTP